MELLLMEWLGTPAWLWLVFMGAVVALLVLDLGVLHRDDRPIGVSESLIMSAFYISLGLAFGGFVWWQLGATPAKEYWTGFVVEKSLAMDNVFVIAMIFSFFAVPRVYQHRVLFWGILGVIVLRGIMIGLGAALIAQYDWILYIFAAFLIVTGVKMWMMAGSVESLDESRVLRFLERHLPVTEGLRGNRFFVRETDARTGQLKFFVTPLFVALLMVEFMDLVFAVDSVPAIFAITTDPFIVYTSNIFAILGLRALYFALAAMEHRFRYLKYALAVLLVFIGSKIFLADILDLPGGKVPPAVSLSITGLILAAGVGVSLWRTRGAPAEATG
jgi:tellurite resistance protein TerC